jgi:hypothetical protein
MVSITQRLDYLNEIQFMVCSVWLQKEIFSPFLLNSEEKSSHASGKMIDVVVWLQNALQRLTYSRFGCQLLGFWEVIELLRL